MKRSEMIKILIEEFINRGMAQNLGAKVAANEILTIIEEQGMLPPITNYYNTILTPPTVTPTGNYEYSFHRGWEPENQLTLEEYKDAYNKGYIPDDK